MREILDQEPHFFTNGILNSRTLEKWVEPLRTIFLTAFEGIHGKRPQVESDAPERIKTGTYTWDDWEKIKKNDIVPHIESGEFRDITESLMPGIVLSSWTMRMLILDTTTNRLYLCCGYSQTPLGWVAIKKTPWQDTVREYEANAIQTGDSST